MEFTMNAYVQLLELLKNKGYHFCFYEECDNYEKTVILRHDIDFTIDKALEMAKIEKQLGVKSTYFVLLTTDFYNIFSKQSYEKLKEILSLGHDIGLHFDERRYDLKTMKDMEQHLEMESKIIEKLLNNKVKAVSMHRPSKLLLEKDIQFNHYINSYSSKYFKTMKYISDSRMNWREDPIQVIESALYKHLHILTHPFWYSSKKETMENKLKDFLTQAIQDRYDFLDNNFTALDQVITRKEISS